MVLSQRFYLELEHEIFPVFFLFVLFPPGEVGSEQNHEVGGHRTDIPLENKTTITENSLNTHISRSTQ